MSTIREITARMAELDRRWNLTVRWHRGWHGNGPLRECGNAACQEAFHEYIGQYQAAAPVPAETTELETDHVRE